MSVFISDIDTAKLYIQFFRALISAVCNFIVLKYMNKTLSGRLRERKNKGKMQVGSPKSGRGRLPERSLTSAFHYNV